MTELLPSDKLRARLRELELTTERAAIAVANAETAHTETLKLAVATGDETAPERSQTALRSAQRELDRATDMATQARGLLAEALKAEREATEAKVRVAINAELETQLNEAAQIDSDFADLVVRVLDLRKQELDLRKRTRGTFSDPAGAPAHLSALRAFASFLATTANTGETHTPPPSVTNAVAAGAHAIRVTLDA